MHDFSSRSGEFRTRRGKWRFDDDEPTSVKRVRRRALPPIEEFDTIDGLPEGDRWSTWDQSIPTQRGPRPHPGWLVTDLAAVDTELGILKTGKEADVFLIRRGVPGGRSCLLAAKRYRDPGHRMFHRDSGYLEGRRVRESRVNRAVASRSAFGREAIAGQWANAEFNALARLYAAGIPVPYPAQILDTELLLEFIGSADGTAAPRLAETRPDPAALAGLWDQLVQALTALARDGLAHGDLSAYNLLVHDGRLVMIDLPQVVDVIANPRGAWYLTRDAENIGRWFTARGLSGCEPGTRGPARPAPSRGLALSRPATLPARHCYALQPPPSSHSGRRMTVNACDDLVTLVGTSSEARVTSPAASNSARTPQIHSAFLSCTEPGSAPDTHTMSPDRTGDDLQAHPVLLVLARVERAVRGNPVDRDQRAVHDDVGVPGLYRVPDRPAQLRRPGGQQFHGLVHVPPGRRGPDLKSRRQFAERLALAQVGQDQQRLPARVQLPPARPDGLPVAPDDPGRIVKGPGRQRQRGRYKSNWSPGLERGSWSTASTTRGSAMPRGDTPDRRQTVTNPSQAG